EHQRSHFLFMCKLTVREMSVLRRAKEMLRQRNEVLALRASPPRRNERFTPGSPARPFTLRTLNGSLSFPHGGAFPGNCSLVFHAFTNRSAFSECLWSSEESVLALVQGIPRNAHLVLLALDGSASRDVLWIRDRIEHVMSSLRCEILNLIHYVPLPVYDLGNWIPSLLYEWTCYDHGCDLDQAVFQSSYLSTPVVVKRLDARYDWAMVHWDEKLTWPLADGGNGCTFPLYVRHAVAFVTQAGDCSFFTKVFTMEKAGAVGVVVMSLPGHPPQDMNCKDEECNTPISIPVSMVPYTPSVFTALRFVTIFVTSATEGNLAEMGWFLYPSLSFVVWQAQWFDYLSELESRLARPATLLPVFNRTVMQGNEGAVRIVTVPEGLNQYTTLELDMALSCPGTRDESCAPWDHTVQLNICCRPNGPLCGQELGRWITPFRRQIGHWLTTVSALLPLFDGDKCHFTMKTVPWAKSWLISLHLRFSSPELSQSGMQSLSIPVRSGGTFNSSYNKKYFPLKFIPPPTTVKVELYAVITGHGSDENGCGEFCVTSHHFVVNGKFANIRIFDNAGTPLGCADQVLSGVVPNEHGTWLYGRDGWCDGREVQPWRVDITKQVSFFRSNTILYYGWYDGKDPQPRLEPGYIIMSSYLVFYTSS
uniref:Si:dkey-256h2.1 n=1 Tax=Eptatretus burgeri TaxID=7764 RepID=A0A8C4QFQ0_EPTBU